MISYEIDRQKYGLPCGPDDPAYIADKWPLSRAAAHFRDALRAFGPHIADLFAANAGESGDLARIAAGGYLHEFVAQVGEFDILASFKKFASDSKLRRSDPKHGTAFVFQDNEAGRAFAETDTVNGLEYYYAGQLDDVYKLWWAMLCENSAPFASLHGWIAGVLQRQKPAPLQPLSNVATSR